MGGVLVQLDAVAVGVGEVDGLAHAVIGGTVKFDARIEQTS